MECHPIGREEADNRRENVDVVPVTVAKDPTRTRMLIRERRRAAITAGIPAKVVTRRTMESARMVKNGMEDKTRAAKNEKVCQLFRKLMIVKCCLSKCTLLMFLTS